MTSAVDANGVDWEKDATVFEYTSAANPKVRLAVGSAKQSLWCWNRSESLGSCDVSGKGAEVWQCPADLAPLRSVWGGGAQRDGRVRQHGLQQAQTDFGRRVKCVYKPERG